MKIWNIVKTISGSELKAHELLALNGFELYTPFEVKRQSVGRGGPKINHVYYAEPILPGWLFIHFDGSDAMKAKLFRTIECRPFLLDVLTLDGELYEFNDIRVQNFKDRLQGLCERGKQGNDRIRARGYDPAKDGKRNLSRGYEHIEIIKFNKGEIVEFSTGAWQGLKFTVKQFEDDMVKLEGTFFGQETIINAPPQSLQKLA